MRERDALIRGLATVIAAAATAQPGEARDAALVKALQGFCVLVHAAGFSTEEITFALLQLGNAGMLELLGVLAPSIPRHNYLIFQQQMTR